MKDPLLTAQAARLLRAESRVRVVQIGAVLDDEWTPRVRAEARENPRYRWLGARPRRETLERIGRAHLVSLTSLSEGGANVVSEAVMANTPLVATRIDGVIGQLGAEYGGYFDVRDAAGLAELITRAECDPAFYRSLQAQCAERRRLFLPETERDGWRALLAELTRI